MLRRGGGVRGGSGGGGGGDAPEHGLGVGLALALLGPAAARGILVGADVRARAARERADLGHVLLQSVRAREEGEGELGERRDRRAHSTRRPPGRFGPRGGGGAAAAATAGRGRGVGREAARLGASGEGGRARGRCWVWGERQAHSSVSRHSGCSATKGAGAPSSRRCTRHRGPSLRNRPSCRCRCRRARRPGQRPGEARGTSARQDRAGNVGAQWSEGPVLGAVDGRAKNAAVVMRVGGCRSASGTRQRTHSDTSLRRKCKGCSATEALRAGQ